MKNRKTLYVSEQFKRKGFLFFFAVIFLGQLFFYFYSSQSAHEDLNYFEPVPPHLFDSIPKTTPKTKNLSRPNKGAQKAVISPIKKDINEVSDFALRSIYGVGPVLSKRIVAYRNAIGGFVHMDQLYEVYGLDSLVVGRIKKQFLVISMPDIDLISVNSATAYELSRVPFISKEMSEIIVKHRARNGLFSNFEEILNIIEIPPDKIHIIQLYLSYN